MRSIPTPLLFALLFIALLLAGCARAAPAIQGPTLIPAPTQAGLTPPAEPTPAPTFVASTPSPTAAAAVNSTPEPLPPTPPTPAATSMPVNGWQPLREPPPPAPLAVRLTPVAQGFTAPVALAAPDDGSGRLFVADQTGLIQIVTIRPRILEEPFLDIGDRLVALQPEGETRGLLGLALHPDYAQNGRFFVHYSAPLRPDGPAGWDHTSHLAEFRAVRPLSDRADPDSERLILQVDQPLPLHNGGPLAFGPDGYLYVSLGDGGVSANGQDTTNLLGSILRLDVDASSDAPSGPYAIPADNPLVGQPGREEIFATGFRNPVQLAFDAAGRLLAADGGPAGWQEINLVTAGGNYGWPLLAGGECATQAGVGAPLAGQMPAGSPAATCLGAGEPLVKPVILYDPADLPPDGGTAVVGGFVYQGRTMPMFGDHYIFGEMGLGGGGRLFIAPPPPPDQAGGPVPAGEPVPAGWPVQELLVVDGENGRLPGGLRAMGQNVEGEIFLLTGDQTLTGRSGQLFRLAPAISAEASLVDSAADYLPLVQQYARIFDRTPVYRSLEDVAAGRPFGSHGEGHTWVTVYEGAEVNGKQYRRVFWDWGTYAWIEQEALHFTSPMSRLQGLALEPGDLAGQRLAITYRPVWVRAEPGVLEEATIAGYLDPWDVITIYEEREVDGNSWYRLGPDQWVHYDYVRLLAERPRPAEIGPDEKWIHINLSQQTVIAYEGDTAVFATLGATGRRAYPTFTGLHRIYAKLRVGPMRWEDSVPPYSLANVPWIMYFNQDQALHGSYWHDLYGSVRSAGCVNLSPHDAHWFFHWADPFYEDGARIVDATAENPGTWVFVEE